MPDAADFPEFLRRIRAGDDYAAQELVARYEPLIRREVRLRIRDDRLNRAFDSVDVSQSVLASFFIRAAVGEYELDQPEQLARLLVTMARNRVRSRPPRAPSGARCPPPGRQARGARGDRRRPALAVRRRFAQGSIGARQVIVDGGRVGDLRIVAASDSVGAR